LKSDFEARERERTERRRLRERQERSGGGQTERERKREREDMREINSHTREGGREQSERFVSATH